MSASFDCCSVSCCVPLYVEFRGCTGLNSEWAENVPCYTWKMLWGTHLHHSPHCILIEAWLVTCSINAPSHPPTPTPSREPWEAESHHHGDLNTDPPHTGPLWLACVEVRGNKMSEQQVFLCFCFCLFSRWDCAQIHVLSYTRGTAGETVGVRETSWFEKWRNGQGNRL